MAVQHLHHMPVVSVHKQTNDIGVHAGTARRRCNASSYVFRGGTQLSAPTSTALQRMTDEHHLRLHQQRSNTHMLLTTPQSGVLASWVDL